MALPHACVSETLSGVLGSMGRTGPADHCVPAVAGEGCVLHGFCCFLLGNKIVALFMKVGKSWPCVVGPSLKIQMWSS